MGMEPIFAPDAQLVAWLKDSIIYDEAGQPIAFLHDNAVFSYEDVYIGRMEHGYFRDEHGDAVAFMRGASGGPLMVSPRVIPTAPTTWRTPSAPAVRVVPAAPTASMRWSTKSWAEYIGQPLPEASEPT